MKKLGNIRKYLTQLVGTIAHEMRHLYQVKANPNCFNDLPNLDKIEAEKGKKAAYVAWEAIPAEIDAIREGNKMSDFFRNSKLIANW